MDLCVLGDVVMMLGVVESDMVDGGGGGAFVRGRN